MSRGCLMLENVPWRRSLPLLWGGASWPLSYSCSSVRIFREAFCQNSKGRRWNSVGVVGRCLSMYVTELWKQVSVTEHLPQLRAWKPCHHIHLFCTKGILTRFMRRLLTVHIILEMCPLAAFTSISLSALLQILWESRCSGTQDKYILVACVGWR